MLLDCSNSLYETLPTMTGSSIGTNFYHISKELDSWFFSELDFVLIKRFRDFTGFSGFGFVWFFEGSFFVRMLAFGFPGYWRVLVNHLINNINLLIKILDCKRIIA